MRAVVTQPGDASRPVVCRDWPSPEPTGDQVLVRIRCAALNRLLRSLEAEGVVISRKDGSIGA